MPRPDELRLPRQLYVRADASRELGTGHVMRTLAIADELTRRGFATTYLIRPAAGDLREVILAHGHRVQEMDDVAGPLSPAPGLPARRGAWLLVDHYDLDGRWETLARRAVPHLAVLDDLGNRRHTADVLIDPNLGASAGKYRGLTHARTRMLLGPRYAPLRPDFARARAAIGPVAERVASIIVTMGGADPGNATALAVRASLNAVPDAVVHVIAGPAFTGRIDTTDPRVRVHRSPSDIASLLASADLVIGAAGTSALERACLGAPSLVLQIADNQTAVAAALAKAGVSLDLGWASGVEVGHLAHAIRALAGDPPLRQAMRDAGMREVDGLGTARIASHIDGIRLRRVRWSDRWLLLQWANDPDTRRNSTMTAPITLDTHLAWLRRNIGDPAIDLVVAQNGLGPVGVLRLAPGWQGELEVSINVAPEHRGVVGSLVLGAGVARWARRFPERLLVARIRPGNHASARIFTRAGFRRTEEVGDTIVYARPATSAATAVAGPGQEDG